MTNRFPDHTSLYVRVEDKENSLVYATYSLGRVISFDEPHAEVDRRNQLHVLQCSAPRMWSYSVIGLDGRLLKHTTYCGDAQLAPSAPRGRRHGRRRRRNARRSVGPMAPGRRRQSYPIGQLIYRLRTKATMAENSSRAGRRASLLTFRALPRVCSFSVPAPVVGREFSHRGDRRRPRRLRSRRNSRATRPGESRRARRRPTARTNDCARLATGWS